MQMNRREFLASTAVAAVALNTASPLFAADKPLEIIDTHTHFYDPTRPQGVPWPPKNDALLYRKVMPADYRAQKVAQPVTATVVVEASAWAEDNQFILDLAKDDKFIIGLSGNLKPTDPDFAKNLKRFVADKKFRGIRVNGRVLAENLQNDAFIADLKRLADADLEMDVNGPPDTLPAIAEIARKLPTLRIVINHLSNIRIDGKTVDATWQKNMEACGKVKHIHAKISGLVEGTGMKDGKAPADAAFYKPQLDAMWQAFGSDKLIYGSNWPVSERFASLATVQQIVHDYFITKGQKALTAVMGGNARAVYKV
ncbi:MAG TPA: amidohydrolase family protein [Verrucomicrobiae bacterium]